METVDKKAVLKQKKSPPVVWEGIVGFRPLNPEGIKRLGGFYTENIIAENIFTDE